MGVNPDIYVIVKYYVSGSSSFTNQNRGLFIILKNSKKNHPHTLSFDTSLKIVISVLIPFVLTLMTVP